MFEDESKWVLFLQMGTGAFWVVPEMGIPQERKWWPVFCHTYITHLIIYSTLTNEQKTYFQVDSSNAVLLYYFSAY